MAHAALARFGGDVDASAVRRAMAMARDMARLEGKYPAPPAQRNQCKNDDEDKDIPLDELYPDTDSGDDRAW